MLAFRRSDIGTCRSTCTDKLDLAACKQQWDALSQEEKDKHGYEYDTYMLLDDLARNLDKRIAEMKSSMDGVEKQNERMFGKNEDREEVRLDSPFPPFLLASSSIFAHFSLTFPDSLVQEKKVLLAKVEELNTQAEAAGDEGDVEKAMALMEQTKALSEQAEAVAAEIKKNARREGTEKKLRVCDVCGVKIELNPVNNEERVNAHYSGKQ